MNGIERARARELDRRTQQELGLLTLEERARRFAIRGFAASWRWRSALFGDVVQPEAIRALG